MLLPALLVVAGVAMTTWLSAIYLRLAGVSLAVVGALGVAAIARQLRQPRLAYEDSRLLINAGTGPAYRVPIELVEGFLLGQGPSMLPGKRYARTETSTFIIRLADKAEAWQQRDIRPSLGKWCGGYVTLRGTWCEPLDVALVERLNFRLAEVSRRIASESRP
jgi:hypothetical protein